MNLLCILLWTYGSGEVELMEEGVTSSSGMVGAGARGEVDPWCVGDVCGWQWAMEVGSGRCWQLAGGENIFIPCLDNSIIL